MKNLKRRAILFALFTPFLLSCSSLRGGSYQGPVSDHFDGKKFHNKVDSEELSFFELIKLQTHLDGYWDEVTEPVRHFEFRQPPQKNIKYTKVGHSTVLIQTGDLNILTDPIWSGRSGPASWSGPLRVRPPAIAMDNLPPIDVVLISHNHYDHMDLPTLLDLEQRFHPLILVGLGNQKFLNQKGLSRVVELDWWEKITVKGTEINFVPAQHLSGRGYYDKYKTLWGGFVVSSSAGPIYFAGDTGSGYFFKEIRRRFGAPSLSFLPIGGYEPLWYLHRVSSNPEAAVLAHLQLGSKMSEGIHYETFRISHEDFNEPIEELGRAKQRHHLREEEFLASPFGTSVLLGPQASTLVQR